MRQAHDEIEKFIENHDMRSAAGLLADCQDSAIAVGTLIEQSEGEDCEVVPAIEDYCEQVYLLHEQLVNEKTVDAGRAQKSLREILDKIENGIKYGIAVRKEVIFLPYKASMWDSLESVWRAADEDPVCDAYVIPIPYYDKNTDGSFGAIHYEGNMYPKYVPVVDYRDYDLASRMPDMIFIHNPYDQFNYVTSVPPLYYAKNLKQYTEKLVYIPYFVLREIAPDDKDAIKNMEHFVTVPGVFYADQVIVQSEDMRTIYINVLAETFGEKTRAMWDKKILGLGSPKMDKVLQTKREDLEIPEEWLKIIRKPDGSKKKVIFYNTGVNALLHYGDKMLAKMRDVFRIFEENKDNVALLWRPHPLIEATISSMRPELRMDYKRIVDQYRSGGWGIYDDTLDLNRAIALSDAYYGDESSVVQLCRQAGKPVMRQDVYTIY